MKKVPTALLAALLGALACASPALTKPRQDAGARWTAERANAWYARQPWLVGCNFIPSTAINQLEMWQADTFDPATIERELGWAADKLGFNTVRVFLHDLAYQADPHGFKRRVGKFLEIADRHGIRPLFVIFDDCWNQDPKAGKQPAPKPGIHNSGWVQSPSTTVVCDPEQWDRLEKYVTDVVGTFADDKRILMWDLYNEPGNEKLNDKSKGLLTQVFAWARKAKPSQPLTVGPWRDDKTLNPIMLEQSDVITFHEYNDAKALQGHIERLKKLGRPLICTEWMARTHGSRVATHLPIFHREKVGCYIWGLVSGKTQTIYPWGSKPNAPEPKEWFHDLFRADGTPFDAKEIELFRMLTGRGKAPKQTGALETRILPQWAAAMR
jgi:Cellulase (glycosyl hydrolase family 5)